MNTVQVVLNYQDYEALPNDGRRYEIHAGELSGTPAPDPLHQETLGNLYVGLRDHVVRRRLGRIFLAPLDVILADVGIVQPDLIFIAHDRASLLTPRGIEGAPTLVVEILSASTIQIDRHAKLQLYARHGVPCYWIVDPGSRLVEAYELVEERYRLAARGAGDESLSAPPFPDLVLPLSSVWPLTSP
jgi:Uma2 family endonuclease